MRTQGGHELPRVDGAPRVEPAGWPRILLYSHEASGIDATRRALLLAGALAEEFAGASLALACGSGALPESRVPAGADLIRLPQLGRIGADRYPPGLFERCADRVRELRREILRLAVAGFAPDLVVVDEFPLGFEGELLGVLEALRASRPGCRLVLGVQDLKGEPAPLRERLRRGGLFEAIDRLYHEVWIYGCRAVFDTVREYGFPEPVARKSHFCGYLQRRRLPSRPRSGLPRVLVTADDDACGVRLIETYLEGLRWLDGRLTLRTCVAFDPCVSSERRSAVLRRFGHLREIEFHDLDAHPDRVFAQADVVISSACYGNVCDILSFGHRAVLVPRLQAGFEQTLRARRLTELGVFDSIEPHALGPDLLISKMLDALESGRRRRGAVDLGGLPHIGERARALLADVAG